MGLIDLLGEPRIRALREVWGHADGNVLLVLIQAYSWYVRYSEGTAAVIPQGLILSIVGVCLMLLPAGLGWQMAYRDHVAVSDEPDPQSHVGAHHDALRMGD
jgi:uncharacterized membrane protein